MGLTKVGKRTVWNGPARKTVPRKALRDQTTGKARGTRVLARGAANSSFRRVSLGAGSLIHGGSTTSATAQ